MALRTGRNYRYAAGGHALDRRADGFSRRLFRDGAIFIAAAALCIPALIALGFIRPEEIDYAQARNAGPVNSAHQVGRVVDLAEEPPARTVHGGLGAVPACRRLDAAADRRESGDDDRLGLSIWISGLIIVPQIVVAMLAPWVGYHSRSKGRKPLLLIGFALDAAARRAARLQPNYAFLVVAQILDGVSGAIIGVVTVIVITDLTTGTGRFNLAQGAVGAMIGIAASVSTLATGFSFKGIGPAAGFIAIAAVAAAATALIWIFVSETKPAAYPD